MIGTQAETWLTLRAESLLGAEDAVGEVAIGTVGGVGIDLVPGDACLAKVGGSADTAEGDGVLADLCGCSGEQDSQADEEG